MNLFLYIPSHSAHPPGLSKSLVYGLMKTYLAQNTRYSDAMAAIRKLYNRLLARRYSQEKLSPLFTSAAATLSTRSNRNKVTCEYKTKSHTRTNNVFFHLPYHPQDISRREIQRIFSNTCMTPRRSLLDVYNTERGASLDIGGMTVAYSRPKNLRDRLNPTTLFETDSLHVRMFAQNNCK